MKYITLVLSLAIFLACSSSKSLPKVKVDSQKFDVGSSGMAQVDSNSFLAVYDLKNFEIGSRIGLIRTFRDSIRVYPVEVKNWKSTESIPNDLESVCKIPGRAHEYLLCESGNWQGKLGRIFHIKLDPIAIKAVVLGIIQLPMMQRNDFDKVGDQYEGIACFPSATDKLLILLAERGGSEIYPDGILRWADIDLKKHTIQFSAAGSEGIPVKSPGTWKSETSKRDLTDLYIDNQGLIWASASQDLGNSGPFYSVIYQLGNSTPTATIPVNLLPNLVVYKEFPSFKIEALSGPTSAVPGTSFSFGTEDEMYGGTWRPVE